ncbi:hypothetical protein CBW46_001470 [Paenibacillus xerothermodurans]|uniref:Uncharacterized protein n=1 Tax=Paenibacillus xerothermodurans TaxID=1977292 RepID=A0A2W1NV66_PAEXE|nr:hypothetical protein CBW46_001470 [Paenibacillus xerothermodurans]
MWLGACRADARYGLASMHGVDQFPRGIRAVPHSSGGNAVSVRLMARNSTECHAMQRSWAMVMPFSVYG